MNDLEERVLDSILKTALYGEALFTILLGAPAVCQFEWTPSADFERELAAKGVNFESWVVELLQRKPLFSRSPSSSSSSTSSTYVAVHIKLL